jgi:hypothetical protein
MGTLANIENATLCITSQGLLQVEPGYDFAASRCANKRFGVRGSALRILEFSEFLTLFFALRAFALALREAYPPEAT